MLFRQWRAFNILYRRFSQGPERARLMAAVQQGITEVQASQILARVADEIAYLSALPPGNLDLPATDPDFRRRTTEDLAIVNDGTKPGGERLAHLMSTVYQVRCNVFHDYKNMDSPRSRKLVTISNRILRNVNPILIENLTV